MTFPSDQLTLARLDFQPSCDVASCDDVADRVIRAGCADSECPLEITTVLCGLHTCATMHPSSVVTCPHCGARQQSRLMVESVTALAVTS